MKVLLLGATGMVGQGVLRECLLDPTVSIVTAVGRSRIGKTDEKLREIISDNLMDLAPFEDQLRGYDACFFCLGVSSMGMTEQSYRRVTYDLTLSVGATLARLNPGLTFIYVSGAGTDSTEQGGSMWARVKGATENALLKLPFRAVYLFRPGFIQPLHGIKSKTKLYQAIYTAIRPLIPLFKALAPNQVTTTEQIGRAMIKITQTGRAKPVLETRDINSL